MIDRTRQASLVSCCWFDLRHCRRRRRWLHNGDNLLLFAVADLVSGLLLLDCLGLATQMSVAHAGEEKIGKNSLSLSLFS